MCLAVEFSASIADSAVDDLGGVRQLLEPFAETTVAMQFMGFAFAGVGFGVLPAS